MDNEYFEKLIKELQDKKQVCIVLTADEEALQKAVDNESNEIPAMPAVYTAYGGNLRLLAALVAFAMSKDDEVKNIIMNATLGTIVNDAEGLREYAILKKKGES